MVKLRFLGSITTIPRFALVLDGQHQYIVDFLVPSIERDISKTSARDDEFTNVPLGLTPDQRMIRQYLYGLSNSDYDGDRCTGIRSRDVFKNTLKILYGPWAQTDGGHFFARGFFAFLP